MSQVPFDVSDVLLDPDFNQAFQITRTTETVNNSGRTVETTVTVSTSGVIHPATKEQLERVPEADRSSEIIAVYSQTSITPGSDTLLPDVVAWKGKTYRCVGLMDWTDYGVGFSEALCASVDMQGKEPSA